MSMQTDENEGVSAHARSDGAERDQWIAYSAWARCDDAWHVADRMVDVLGCAGARGLALALARAERVSTGREAFTLNEARLMVLGAIARRWR